MIDRLRAIHFLINKKEIESPKKDKDIIEFTYKALNNKFSEKELYYEGDLTFFKQNKIPAILPDNFTVDGNLDIGFNPIDRLPRNLTVLGNMRISSTKISRIPSTLRVDGQLNLSYLSTIEIEQGAQLKGIWSSETKNIILPENFKTYKLTMRDSGTKELPKYIEVGYHLNVNKCSNISKLPDNLNTEFGIYADDTNLSEIPKNMKTLFFDCMDTPLLKAYTPKEIYEMIKDKGGDVQYINNTAIHNLA